MVHPESYDLARWLLKEFSWRLDEVPTNILPLEERKIEWGSKITKAAKKFSVSEDRVLAVIENLILSMMNIDPRIDDSKKEVKTNAGSTEGCSLLSAELAEMGKLEAAAPVRGIIGTIRNIADFGAFIDFGGHNDGLLHTSKLGPLHLSNLLIGQQIGVDILSVSNGKVSLGAAGLNLQPDTTRFAKSRPMKSAKRDSRSGSKRSISTKKRTASSTSFKQGGKRQRIKK
mmetsp:Transcript_36707/g.54832  ORF Transcript_36707/g.54832 Transcript_36707/m.54832 type:complete len:229 (+) Transcript_36707:1486-2172(+)